MLKPEKFKELTKQLNEAVKKQEDVSAKAGLSDKNANEDLANASRQLNDDTLRVLVMGKFSSGKSTFLNAMMGQELLPAKAEPTTAIISEIIYADKPEAILYPKKSKEPITVDISEMNKYVVIDHSETKEDKKKAETPFKKMIIKYPLNVCKHGIMLIDSPGLDDPTCHDTITEEYLPSADAILYCMNSTAPFSAKDKMEIERLVALGYKSIIFVMTYFDVILNNDEMRGTNDSEQTKQYCYNNLAKYTDLGKDGIFFVSSLNALYGKIRNNQQQLEKSNFPPLEKRLEEILYNEKGRMKLLKAVFTARRVNRATTLHLSDLIEMTNSNKAGLSERIHKAQDNLNQAQAKAHEISTQFKIGSQSIVKGAEDRGLTFFVTSVIPKIDDWVKEFEPSDDQSISAFHPKSSTTAFTEACLKFVQGRMEAEMANWIEKDLAEGYLVPQLKAITAQQDSNLASFEEDLKKLRANMNLSLDSDEISEDTPGTTNRILSAIAGAFLNPASLVVGGAFGWKGLVTSLITTLVSGMVLGVISMFTPIGLPAVIIGYVIAAIVAGGITFKGMEGKVRKSIVEKLKAELSEQKETAAKSIGQSVAQTLEKVSEAVENSLNAPVNDYKKILEEAKHTVNAQENDIAKRTAQYSQLRKDNSKLADDFDLLSQEISV